MQKVYYSLNFPEKRFQEDELFWEKKRNLTTNFKVGKENFWNGW